jgi:hypothetical protein
MKHTPKAGVTVQKTGLAPRVSPLEFNTRTFMKSIMSLTLALLAMVTISAARELPDAPSAMTPTGFSSSAESTAAVPAMTFTAGRFDSRIMDKKFLSLAVISTGATFADSYTTLFARENWLAHKTGVCNMEVESAYLYGTHPTVPRTYAVAAVKSAGSLFAAYYLRKHHSKLWAAPLLANSVIGLQGVTQNMINCN